STREQQAQTRFVCTASERAAFEAGIKMATVYHQFVGTPFDETSRPELEQAIAAAIRVQPYVTAAAVHIVLPQAGRKEDQYSYSSLTGEMIDAVVTIALDGVKCTAEMRYDPGLKYPLMYISRMERV
ncbi:MAG: dihydroneopterin aldolase family protein, partial [Candidatus Methanomethylophilus sp.]|nr:dihydroneopterin aldolase family protein [Methanomethylophilus sp.]